MSNQLNFPDPLPQTLINERPSRFAHNDTKLFQTSDINQVVFGVTDRDVVEVWVYYPNGEIAAHTMLSVFDQSIKLSTVMDNTGAYEFINLDLGELSRRMNLEQGRYGLTVNIFRNEIGSEEGEKLYIGEISDDRTEIRLTSKNVGNGILRDIYEFVTPSVPKIIAQGLTDQLFGKNIDLIAGEQLNVDKITVDVDLLINNTSTRINYADANYAYGSMINTVLDRSYKIALENMASDVSNLNVQEADLEKYLSIAIQETIRQMRSAGEIDNRFEVS